MTRPETVSDLSGAVRAPVRVAWVDLEQIANMPRLMRAWTEMTVEAEAAGLELRHGTILRPRTVPELEQYLADRQAGWDRCEHQYRQAMAGAPEPRPSRALREWCVAEGRAYPYPPRPRPVPAAAVSVEVGA